ncbi:MAG: hypothetical protein AAGA99_22275 [Actinomycetota bacterium]
MVGQAVSGKSTLINWLLGEDLAQVGFEPQDGPHESRLSWHALGVDVIEYGPDDESVVADPRLIELSSGAIMLVVVIDVLSSVPKWLRGVASTPGSSARPVHVVLTRADVLSEGSSTQRVLAYHEAEIDAIVPSLGGLHLVSLTEQRASAYASVRSDLVEAVAESPLRESDPAVHTALLCVDSGLYFMGEPRSVRIAQRRRALAAVELARHEIQRQVTLMVETAFAELDRELPSIVQQISGVVSDVPEGGTRADRSKIAMLYHDLLRQVESFLDSYVSERVVPAVNELVAEATAAIELAVGWKGDRPTSSDDAGLGSVVLRDTGARLLSGGLSTGAAGALAIAAVTTPLGLTAAGLGAITLAGLSQSDRGLRAAVAAYARRELRRQAPSASSTFGESVAEEAEALLTWLLIVSGASALEQTKPPEGVEPLDAVRRELLELI